MIQQNAKLFIICAAVRASLFSPLQPLGISSVHRDWKVDISSQCGESPVSMELAQQSPTPPFLELWCKESARSMLFSGSSQLVDVALVAIASQHKLEQLSRCPNLERGQEVVQNWPKDQRSVFGSFAHTCLAAPRVSQGQRKIWAIAGVYLIGIPSQKVANNLFFSILGWKRTEG